jgi:hypothetical protein
LIDESLSDCVENVFSSLIIPPTGIKPHEKIKIIKLNKIKYFLFIFTIHTFRGLLQVTGHGS